MASRTNKSAPATVPQRERIAQASPWLKVASQLRTAMRHHWPEYAIEAFGLGAFMISACLFGIALFHAGSPIVALAPSEFVRRVLMGLAMGSTSIALTYSAWGQQSGAHFNPAVTATFWRLGKIDWPDAAMYAVAQSCGGIAGVGLVASAFPGPISVPEVNYVATVPGPGVSPLVAWLVEFGISALLMSVVLWTSNRHAIARLTGLAAGGIVALNITIAAPWSGMSMNPARTIASAIPSGVWTALAVYLTAPPAAMLLAATIYVLLKGRGGVFCAKIHHQNAKRCIFCQSRMDRTKQDHHLSGASR
jgi:aquaporin Z